MMILLLLMHMYVAITFKKNLVTENPNMIELFKKDTGKNLKLRSHEISVINDTCNDLTIEQIIERINIDTNINIIIKSIDLN